MNASEPVSLNVWGRRGVTCAWVATALLTAPALRAGFLLDDFLQRLTLEGAVPGLELGPATLYDFTGGDHGAAALLERGYLPWFADPQLELRFFRPLSSLTLALEQALFRRGEVASHVVGAALFVLTTAVAIALFKRLLTPNRAGLSAFLFAVAGGHAFNLTWSAGRHVLVGGLFGALAVLAHLVNAERAENQRSVRALVAPAALLLALLASETSLAALGMIGSYELIATERPLRRRLGRAALWFGAGLVYLALYSAAGYGVKHSGLYVSPLAAPAAFGSAALTRLPMLLGELTFAVPASLWGLLEPLRPAFAAFGALATLLVVWLARRVAASAPERRKIAWLAGSALLGTLTMVGGVPDGRTLLIPLLASMPLVATAIDGAWNQPAKSPRVALRAASGLLLFAHLVVAVLARVGVTEVVVDLAKKQRRLAESADFSRCAPGSPAFLVTGADPSLCLSGGTALSYFRPEFAARNPRFDVLSFAPHDQRIERTSRNGIVLHIDGQPRHPTIFEQLFRDTPLGVGQRVALEHFQARVLAAERGLPTRVAFELPENACLLTLEQHELVGRPLPAVGTTRKVPHELGPMGL